MYGAIAGDIIGSVYEHNRVKSTDFDLFTKKADFTDDTVLTVATVHALLRNKPFEQVYRDFGRRHPHRGYGGNFAL